MGSHPDRAAHGAGRTDGGLAPFLARTAMHHLEYLPDKLVRAGRDTFAYGVPPQPGPDERIPPVFKSRVLLDQLQELVHRLEPSRLLEFGIFRGGSVALLASLVEPDKQVAIELATPREEALDHYIHDRGLEDQVVAEYGVDQGSPEVAAILDREFGTDPIDLVIDDASHLYAPSRRAFEMAFPRVRTGGIYIIEDWAAEHTLVAAMTDAVVKQRPNSARYVEQFADRLESLDPDAAAALRRDPSPAAVNAAARALTSSSGVEPLSRLVLELVHLAAESVDVVRSIRVTQGWIEIERGTASLEHPGWLDEGSKDLYGSLAPRRPG